VFLATSSSQPDLSELRAIQQPKGGFLILSWPSLLRRHSLTIGTPDEMHAGMEVSALGYAMEPERPLRNGERVKTFVLLPDSGNLLHPAHRFGDQMIEVCLRQGESFEFRAAELVWVHGWLRILPGNPLGQVPLYQLERAHVDAASRTAITQFFRLAWE